MIVARRLWELSHGQATGALRLARADGATAPLSVELSRGWVYGVDLSPAWSRVGDAPAQGADRLRLLLSLTVGSGAEAYVAQTWESPPKPPRRGPVQPFHPAAALRNHVEQQKPSVSWRLRAGKLQLAVQPHASCVGQDERALIAFLAQPRTAGELERMAVSIGAAAERTERLLAFLDAVGALSVTLDASPFKILELTDGASPDEVRQAYRRLAMELHPDRHPNAGPDELRELERRFAEVSAAYRRLV